MTLKPGDLITWTHCHADGSRTERSGEVWDRAPEWDGAKLCYWVVPYEPLPSDPYAAIAVGKATRASTRLAPGLWGLTPAPTIGKGALYSSDYDTSGPRELTRNAASHAATTRDPVLPPIAV